MYRVPQTPSIPGSPVGMIRPGSTTLGIGMPASAPTQLGIAELLNMLQDPNTLAMMGTGKAPMTPDEQAILQALSGGMPAQTNQQALDMMTLLDLLSQLKQAGAPSAGPMPGAAYAQPIM